jgi:hypothetical protein
MDQPTVSTAGVAAAFASSAGQYATTSRTAGLPGV